MGEDLTNEQRLDEIAFIINMNKGKILSPSKLGRVYELASGREKRKSNRFDQLVDDLINNKINMTMIQIAVRTYIRHSKNIPEECKSILCGSGDSNAGIIYKHFKLIEEIIGGMDLAVRRAKD